LEEVGEYNDEEDCLRWIGNKIRKFETDDPDKML
jgi:DNA-directed RNA polymerase II subunit RPB2